MNKVNETETGTKKNVGQKIKAFVKRHLFLTGVLAALFACTFFLPAESVDYRYSGKEIYQYVRVEYSLYGYCVNVAPMYQTSVEEAANLNKLMLFTGVDEATDTVTKRWTEWFGTGETFTVRVKGFRHNNPTLRDDIIEKIKAKGYKADALL